MAEILYTLVPLAADVGLEVQWQHPVGAPGVLQRHQELPQRPAGHAVDIRRRRAHGYEVVCRANAASSRGPTTSSSSTTRSRSPIATSFAEPGPLHLVDLALPHRHLHARPRPLRLPAAVHRRVRRRHLHAGRVRARGAQRPRRRDRPDHRPARAEEHGALARGRHLHRAPVRRRRGAPAPAPGLALRPLEGPARGGRRLPHRQGEAPGRAARAARLHGQRRPGGLGVPRAASSTTSAGTPTSSSSPTSTTSAPSRSTRSRVTPTWSCRSRRARASG